MLARWLSLLIWALVAASGVFWGLKLWARPLAAPAQTQVASVAPAAGADLSRLFGAELPAAAPEAAPPPPPESSRFQLIGVVAPRAAGAQSQGVALIAVDGKAPRAFRVGAVVDGDQVLKSVQARAAAIGPRQGAATVSLELPALPPPSTGVPMPGGISPGMSGMAPGAVPAQVFVPPPGAPVVGVPSPAVVPNPSRMRTFRGPAGSVAPATAGADLPGEPPQLQVMPQGAGSSGIEPRPQR